MIETLLDSLRLSGSTEAFSTALFRRFPKAIRLRRDVSPAALPLTTVPVPWYPLGRWPHPESMSPTRVLNFPAGDYYLQDAGSLLALAVAGTETDRLHGKLICDLCAAPGGKATALVEAIGNSGFVLANETVRSRLGALKLNLARTGSDRWTISSLDPERLAGRLGGIFDIVLVDAPCSGQALLGRGKQNQAALTSKQIMHSAARQRRILDAAVRLARPGGLLVYSTCTFAEAENETQVRRLVADGAAVPHPVNRFADYQTEPACYRLWPHLHDCAGAFAATLLIEQSDRPGAESVKTNRIQSVPEVLDKWYSVPKSLMRCWQSESIRCGIPADAPAWVEEISIAGPELAHRVGQTWRPAHAGALRRGACSCAAQTCRVDDQTAKQFLRGESIPCCDTGWAVVCWQDRPLGWVKADGAQGKNHLPKAARMHIP